MKLKNIMIGTLLTCSAVVPAGAGAVVAPATAAQQDIVNGDYERNAQVILQEINSYRKSKGLPPVKYSQKLSGIAQDESNRAVRDENPNHSMKFLRDARAGSWNNAGEVTALEYSVNPKALVNWWKQSPAHNKFLLDRNVQVVGIGVTFADGSLSRTHQPWRILATVDGYGYSSSSKMPADAKTSVTGSGSSYSAPVQHAASNAVPTRGAIGAFYNKNKSMLGSPVRSEITGLKDGGAVQHFAHSNGAKHSVYWNPKLGTNAVKTTGGIGSKYARGGSENKYGYPVSAEKNVNGAKAYQFFRNGSQRNIIMWSPSTGTHHIIETGAIGKAWVDAGREHNWGLPVTDEFRGSDGKVHQKFSNGVTVTWLGGSNVSVSK